MRKLLFLLLLFIPIPSFSEEIHVMYFNAPPFIIANDQTGALSGATYDFLENYIAPELKITFKWDNVATVIPRQISTLTNSENYMSALMVYTPERAKVVLFSESPYLEDTGSLAVLTSNPLKRIEKIEDVLPLKIGYAKGLYIGLFLQDKRVNYEYVSNSDFVRMNLRMMMAGRIDAAYAPSSAQLSYEATRLNIKDKIRILDLPDKKTGMNVAFSKSSKEMVKRYNRAFNNIGGKKIYLQILKKYEKTLN